MNTWVATGRQFILRWLRILAIMLAVTIMAALAQVITTLVLPFAISKEIFNGIIGAVFFYLIFWDPLSADARPASFLQFRIPLRERLKIMAYIAILLVWAVAVLYMTDEELLHQLRLLKWGSLLSGLLIGFLIASAADAYLQRRKGGQRKIQGSV